LPPGMHRVELLVDGVTFHRRIQSGHR
jgi:hypothetical protein